MREFVSMAVNYGNTDEVATTARTIAITAEVRAAMSDVDVSGAVTRICVEIGLLPDWLEGKLGLVETAARHGMRIPLWWAGSPNAARMYTAARVTKGVNVGDGAIVQRSYGAIKERVARGGDVRVDYQETSEGWVILPQDLLQSPEPYMTQSPGPYMSDEEGRTPPACTSPFYRPESESDTSGTGSPYPY
jgi:hypothetical protein